MTAPFLSARRELKAGVSVGLSVDEPTLLSSSTDICVRGEREPPIAVREFLCHVRKEFDGGRRASRDEPAAAGRAAYRSDPGSPGTSSMAICGNPDR